MQNTADIIVIGAGIAGVSAAAELAAHASVLLLEMEPHPGYHATGRSAAFFAPCYGNHVVRGITAASGPFYRRPPAGFSATSLLRPRDYVIIACENQRDRLEALHVERPELQRLSATMLRQRVPILATAELYGALCDVSGGDLDVDAILQGYLRLFRHRHGTLMTAHRIQSMQQTGGGWRLHSDKMDFNASIVVNAGGAWADDIAALAGLKSLGITPMRRTALLIDAPANLDIRDWPMVLDIDEAFYFKPDAGQLLLSPADETPSIPCDARAEELDVAVAVDRFEKLTLAEVHRVNHRWAGLRSFAADRSFVAGFDPRADGFFWLAGQGGYGVQSAPGLAQLTSSLITGVQPAAEFASVIEFTAAVAPARLLKADELSQVP